MNPSKEFPTEKPQAQEGRFVSKDGVDHGDQHFHELGWGFDEDAEQRALEDLATFNGDGQSLAK